MINKLLEIVEYAAEARREYNRRQACKKELSRLTERELNDIGINRCDIERISRGASRA